MRNQLHFNAGVATTNQYVPHIVTDNAGKKYVITVVVQKSFKLVNFILLRIDQSFYKVNFDSMRALVLTKLSLKLH